jgi:hypothetical protein
VQGQADGPEPDPDRLPSLNMKGILVTMPRGKWRMIAVLGRHARSLSIAIAEYSYRRSE